MKLYKKHVIASSKTLTHPTASVQHFNKFGGRAPEQPNSTNTKQYNKYTDETEIQISSVKTLTRPNGPIHMANSLRKHALTTEFKKNIKLSGNNLATKN